MEKLITYDVSALSLSEDSEVLLCSGMSLQEATAFSAELFKVCRNCNIEVSQHDGPRVLYLSRCDLPF